jgi:hypothetical protein
VPVHVDSDELRKAIIKVLLKAKRGSNGGEISYMTAYQIFQKLPKKLREELEKIYGKKQGAGAGQHFTSANRVAKVTATIPRIQVAWLDTRFLHFMQKEGRDVRAGYGLVELFRLPKEHRLRK